MAQEDFKEVKEEDILVDEKGDVIEAKEDDDAQDTNDDENEHHEAADAAEDDAAESDDEREAIRARRREERQHKKQAQREREETLRRELAARDEIINELQSRVAVVERNHQGSEEAQIESAIKDSADAYNFFKQQIAVAAQNNDGAGIADATEKMILAQRRYEELNRVKTGYQQNKNKPQALDPRLVNHAKAWMERNSWYDPNGGDINSRMALEIDRDLSKEGWNPTTPQYWEELEARVKKQLPNTQRTVHNRQASRSVVSGSGRESAPTGNGGTYKLSADRVAALKDAGMWDDPKARAEAIKRFKEHDKQQAAGQR